MCGIAGALTRTEAPSIRAIVQNVLESQRKRGPDFEALEEVRSSRSHVVLAHNRLSIIDLSSAAHQPMWDGAGNHCIVFNGEIYNYVELRAELRALGHEFRTTSDTEVLLTAVKEWGTAALGRLNGMFAFALLDKATGRLLLARDRFGVKPLYYRTTGETLLFASTAGRLAAEEHLQPDLSYVARGLDYWLYEDERDASPFVGLRALAPGHFLETWIDGDGLQTRLERYYDLTARVAAAREAARGRTVTALVGGLRELLDDAVRVRMRADVVVGVSLSGGLDSTTIAASLATKHDRTTGFTFGRPDVATSEGPLVSDLAKMAKIDVDYVWPTTRAFVDAFWEVLGAQDGPFAGLSIIAQHLVFQAARRAGVKVLLGGQGADEVFAGYRKFAVFRLQQDLRRGALGRAAADLPDLARMAVAELPRLGTYWRSVTRYGNTAPPRSGRLALPEANCLNLALAPGETLVGRQIRDILSLSLPTLLRYEDRNSMGNSIESRLPYLDYRLVEYGLALPDGAKIREGFGKWALRQAAKGRIPESIRLARFKRGFDAQDGVWIRGGLGVAIRSELATRRRRLDDLLPSGTDIGESFSDERLERDSSTMAAAISLLWLAERR
jgi:asparagine synthase (glutamine-hydrolysing)